MGLDFINDDLGSYKSLIEMIVSAAGKGSIDVDIPNVIHVKYSPSTSSVEPNEEQMKKIREKSNEKTTAEQLAEAFAGQMEEFYPYGKPNNNQP